MRISDFWRLMDDEFGSAYSRVLAADLVLTGLSGRTAQQALESGIDPKRVWLEVCEMQEVPQDRRLGRDIKPKQA
ncbi:DUF3046 domain-containing protein [Arthrobacter koreensis]|uniref:DUF3046 domain-containing protein n=1 Tax=Arthrobacter koreensis TaxID=199136 RepID=UPI002DB87F95|nr:DUF3046 domain-containing protein [Arthrobacter koreensis]MEB7505943.1 DUF3046 domain-containing protein [Arthrobacter koreensis]